jgi:hypothetical protein
VDGGPADGGVVEGFGDWMRARQRRRNARTAMVSAGLIGLSLACLVLFVTGFASVGASRATPKSQPAAAPRKPAPRVPPPTTVAPTTTTSSTTVPPTTSTTSTSTTTTVPPPTTTTTTRPRPTTTTTLARVTATVTVSDEPTFCTVTVHLSTGAFRVYPLDSYLQNPGDRYEFTASFGGYHMDVRARVVDDGNDGRQCKASTSKPTR